MLQIEFRIIFRSKVVGYERLTEDGWEWMCLELNPDNGERWTSGAYPNGSKYIRNQFIGIKDCKKQKIYTDDVVKGVNKHKGQSEVFFDTNALCYQPFSYLDDRYGENFEVIGNIHENPELTQTIKFKP